MSGIKQLFHEYNQQLMEFMSPPMASPMGMSPMMGYNPMMMKPAGGMKPFNPWDPNANKDKKKDNFWKILLALGAAGGAGLGGWALYNQHQKNTGLKKEASKFAGKMVGLHGEDVISMLFNGAQQHMAHQQNVQNHQDYAEKLHQINQNGVNSSSTSTSSSTSNKP